MSAHEWTGWDRSGYHQFHPDVSINFQCNRWLQWIGPSAMPEIAAVAAGGPAYPQLIDGFLSLAAAARAEGRAIAAAYYDRAAEFFMLPGDERSGPARARFLDGMAQAYPARRVEVAYGAGALTAYDLAPVGEPRETVVVFGGFDSYIEEFFPLLSRLQRAGMRLVAFDGPGQGSALEEFGLRMAPEWERPVGVVLDHFGLTGVTIAGISLGGGLAIRAAAMDPRVERVIALDIMDDELESALCQLPRLKALAARRLLDLRARRVLEPVLRREAATRPIAEWGFAQGMHVTGTGSPFDFLQQARRTTTAAVSARFRGDALLLAGADDHYVPLHQLHRQAANLVNARSVTTRVFTAAEDASNHCQVGHLDLLVRVLMAWLDTVLPVSAEVADSLV